jgi:crotonobetainyl-CoA:carnitine CoA-transferase CaiB-like acyl-CoA transferase
MDDEPREGVNRGPLTGVRVLDFGRYIAGPYCAALLAEYGADVIRIERRGGGEDRFFWELGEGRAGALFNQINRNKRSLTLDPQAPEGRAIVAQLVATADVVVANLPPSVLEAMGLDYESLRGIKDDIIVVSSTAFGLAGPMADEAGFDAVGQVMSGAAYMSGSESGPSRSFVPFVDFGTALHSAFGVLLALMERRRGGGGQRVAVSLLQTSLLYASAPLLEEAALAHDRAPAGNASPIFAPCDIYRCQDGWIFVQVLSDPIYRRWAKLMGDASLLSDARFATDASRGAHGGVLNGIMADWCGARTQAQALAALSSARVPAAPVLRPRETLAHPQVQALDMMRWAPSGADGAATPLFRLPLELSALGGRPLDPPPTPGQHTDAILSALGYDATAIQSLRDREIV